jgi:ABC-type Mn2+/Zn2+ transport system ATPase subunit
VLVELQRALFGYGSRPVVRVEQLHLHPGRCLGVFGPNGVGKTTLIRGITGLLRPIEGSVVQIGSVRFGYLPQHRGFELQWPMTALDAAAMAVSSRAMFGWVGPDIARVRAAMDQLGVTDLSERRFARLSGGQQQRVLLAGALASEPQVLVLDEPTDGLDMRSRQTLLDLLHEENGKGLCTVMISHDVEDLLRVADEIAWVHPGEESGEASRVEVVSSGVFDPRGTRGLGERSGHRNPASDSPRSDISNLEFQREGNRTEADR